MRSFGRSFSRSFVLHGGNGRGWLSAATAARRSFASEAKAAATTAATTAPPAPEQGNKRSARSGPRFQKTRTFIMALSLTAACGFGVYAVRVAYFHFRPEGNDRAIVLRLQDEMRLHPHWAAAMVYALAHHALSDSKEPFGAPLVCHRDFEAETRQVLALLRELQLQYPGSSLPDLWCCAVTYAVASLGGPLISVYWGRYEEEFPPDPVVVRDAVINSSTRDVSVLKRVMMKLDFAPDEIVALMGHRTLGCHGSGDSKSFQLGLMKRASDEMLATKKFIIYDGAPSEQHLGFGTETPGVFDHDYFVTIAEAQWELPKADTKKKGLLWGANKSNENAASTGAPVLATCPSKHPHVRMEPLDLALKEDSLMTAWLLKFAENEIRFFNSFERAASRVMRMGWEGSQLR